jgi:hypothetical protein
MKNGTNCDGDDTVQRGHITYFTISFNCNRLNCGRQTGAERANVLHEEHVN